jgi:hypothetical protein
MSGGCACTAPSIGAHRDCASVPLESSVGAWWARQDSNLQPSGSLTGSAIVAATMPCRLASSDLTVGDAESNGELPALKAASALTNCDTPESAFKSLDSRVAGGTAQCMVLRRSPSSTSVHP